MWAVFINEVKKSILKRHSFINTTGHVASLIYGFSGVKI
jgi:hypothetical protein